MLNKLTLRNALRSAKDYLIYVVTVAFISALMFAFHGMIFSGDMRAVYRDMTVFIALIGMASFFIIFIIIWLVHYIVNFMIERRSREFGTYLLLGMGKKRVARIFRRENILLGFLSLMLGILPGFLMQKLFINIFYAVMATEYRISAEFNLPGLLITVGVMVLAYLLALLKTSFRFGRMQIRDLIYQDKRNEKIINENRTWKKVLVFLAVAYIILFNILVLRSAMGFPAVWFYLLGLVAAIYLLYIGLSSLFVNFIRKKYRTVYQEANIFILRQLASKIKTMRFTMGTLSILFTAAMLGWMLVMMFGDFQRREVPRQLPFDILVFSDRSDADFNEELELIKQNVKLTDSYIYRVYQNGTTVVNDYLYAHRDGTHRSGVTVEGKMRSSTYFGFDTYLGLSDYNRIRGMIGLEPVILEAGHYLLHGSSLIDRELPAIRDRLEIKTGGQSLPCQAIRMEPISQSGMNGADYILVVPDANLALLTPYYSLLAASLTGAVPADLEERLLEIQDYYSEEAFMNFYDIEVGFGSGQVVRMVSTALVAKNTFREVSYVITVLCFVFAYLGVVFLCTAMTILAVQQLSDAAKYQFRYRILRQLGVDEAGIRKVVFKQLAVYYLCPMVISIVLSMFIGLFASERFVYYTGINAGIFQYYLLGVLMFGLIYGIYFTVSYVGFLRNLKLEP